MTGAVPVGDGFHGENSIAGKHALVMGLGAFGGGLGTARWLKQQGAQVTVTDLADASVLANSISALADLEIEYVLGQHRPESFRSADLVVANPAVPTESPWLKLARASGAEVTSEVALFLERVRGRVIGITGTQGKSSTVSMTQQLLRGAGQRAHCGGNIGGSLLGALASIQAQDFVVLELSSYQLEALPQRDWPARVEAVAITNLLADHLERHGDRACYCAAKLRLLDLVRTSGLALLPAESESTETHLRAKALAERARWHGLRADDRETSYSVSDGRFHYGREDLGAVADLGVPGGFQVANALVALGLAHHVGVPSGKLARLLPTLSGLDHRMQDLGQRGAFHVIDNGVSTTPDSTEAVLEDVPRGSFILLGGKAKRLDFEPLARALIAHEMRPYVFGAAKSFLCDVFEGAGLRVMGFDSLEEAVAEVVSRGESGSTLLFSPACASFDAFTNFRARAERFEQLLPPRNSRAAQAGPKRGALPMR